MRLFKRKNKKPYDPYYKGFTCLDDEDKTASDYRLERDIAVAKLGDKINELEELQKKFDALYDKYIDLYLKEKGKDND